MTETVNTEPVNENAQPVENEQTPEVLPPLPPLLAANYDVLLQLSTDASSLARRIKAQGNETQLIADILDTSDDEKIVSFRAFVEEHQNVIARAEETIAQYVREHKLPKDENALDVGAATEEYKTKRKHYNDLSNALRGVVEPADFELLIKRLPEMEALGRKSGGGATSGGTGTKRTRIDRILVKNVNAPNEDYKVIERDVKDPKTGLTEKKTSMGILTDYLSKLSNTDVDASSLREHADSEAGTSDWKSLNGKPFEFAYRVSDDVHVMIQITPRPAPSANVETSN